jgi:bis(5'-nucleosidyl)-tetraphosphatase
MTKNATVRAAGMLILCRRNDQVESFLLMKHADRWDLPKGHCDGHESFTQTAIREVQEETGLTPEQYQMDRDFHFDLRYRVVYKRRGRTEMDKHVRYFLAFVDQPWPIQLTEHPESHWMIWNPPHRIQEQTIDPLLEAVAQYLAQKDLAQKDLAQKDLAQKDLAPKNVI